MIITPSPPLIISTAPLINTVEKGTGVNLPTGSSLKPNDKFATLKENAGAVQNNIDLKTDKAKVETIPSTMDNSPAKTVLVKNLDEQNK